MIIILIVLFELFQTIFLMYQEKLAKESLKVFQNVLNETVKRKITTEIKFISKDNFYYAEDYHQQYLKVNPDGYCNHKLGKLGVKYPTSPN